MPRNINYRPILIDELITNERLNSYKAVFNHSDDVELVGAYLWNAEVCSALYPLLTAAEIALRNSIDTALARSLGTFWWRQGCLRYRSFSPGVRAPFPVSAIQSNFSKATDQVRNEKKTRYKISGPRPTPTHHEVISKTEFSTWQFILDHEFMGSGLIWPSHLGSVFRGRWPTNRTSSLLSSTKDLVKTVREFRNRVSHHEPVWKRYGVNTEADAIAHLHEKLSKITTLISLISPDKSDFILKNGILSRAERICSISELRRCQHIFNTYNVKSISKLCQVAQKSLRDNSTEQIIVYKYGKTKFIIQPA